MQDDTNSERPTLKRIPWNRGKLIGAKPPLRQKHVWAIRTKLPDSDLPPDNGTIFGCAALAPKHIGMPLAAVPLGCGHQNHLVAAVLLTEVHRASIERPLAFA